MKAARTSWVGQQLAGGRYQVTARLGAGGMGVVYKAQDNHLKTEVVIKVPRPELLTDEDTIRRFTTEIRALTRLAHPHVVRVFDVGEHREMPFAVLQYLADGSLEDRLEEMGRDRIKPWEPAQLAGWLEEVAKALDFIHKRGYVHRDVKPGNILFDHGNVYLSDFGIIKALAANAALQSTPSANTDEGLAMGTPKYMAPELCQGQPLDGRVDQYALGILVYELLAGQIPFDVPSAGALLIAHSQQPPPRLDTKVRGLPKALVNAVDRCLAKDPRRRFESCTAFAQAVLGAVRGGSVALPNLQPNKGGTSKYGSNRVACPRCGHTFAVSSEEADTRLRCPVCQAVSTGPQRRAATRSHAVVETGAGAHVDTKPDPADKPSFAGLVPRPHRLAWAAVAALVLVVPAAAWLAPWQGDPDIVQVEVDPPSPPQLLPIDAVSLLAGASREVLIEVDRRGHAGPIPLDLQGLPPGVRTASEAPAIPEDRNSAIVQVSAAPEAAEGEHQIVVRARHEGGEVTTPLTLKLSRPPSLAVEMETKGSVVLEAGQSRTCSVRIKRQACRGQVQLSIEGLPSSVRADSISIGELAETGRLTLQADANAVVTVKEARIVAKLGELEGRCAVRVTINDSWRDFEPPGGNFKVRLPGEPSHFTRQESIDGNKHTFQIYELRQPGSLCGISYFDLPKAAASSEEALNGARDGLLKSLRGRLLREDKLSLMNAVGRDIECERTEDGALIRLQLYLAGQRLYVLKVEESDKAAPTFNAPKFFQSFAIIRVETGTPPPPDSFQVTVASSLTIEKGEATDLQISVKRKRQRPMTIRLICPKGITIGAYQDVDKFDNGVRVTLPEDRDSVRVRVSVASNSPDGDREVRLVARMSGEEVTQVVAVKVQKSLTEKLAQPITIDKPIQGALSDVLTQLGRRYALPIVIDTEAFQNKRIDSNTQTVQLRAVRDTRLSSVLQEVLSQARASYIPIGKELHIRPQ